MRARPGHAIRQESGTSAAVLLIWVLLAAVMAVQGCGGGSTASTGPVAAINVSPTSGTIGLNGQQTFTATAQDASGKTLNATFTWASSATNIATIDGSGVATGHSAGTVQITASVGNVTSAAVPLTVINASIPVASVTLSPISATIQVGQSEQFTATAVDTSGNTLSGAPITWHNSAAGVAVVSTSGMATGISPGTAIITAAVGNVSSPAATLTVTGP